jgi:1-aminocyclopropane-1-carboxylate deaminase/D-cysteine desulfhydrase-like pyridoxal-dependent ACC family enzyme
VSLRGYGPGAVVFIHTGGLPGLFACLSLFPLDLPPGV